MTPRRARGGAHHAESQRVSRLRRERLAARRRAFNLSPISLRLSLSRLHVLDFVLALIIIARRLVNHALHRGLTLTKGVPERRARGFGPRGDDGAFLARRRSRRQRASRRRVASARRHHFVRIDRGVAREHGGESASTDDSKEFRARRGCRASPRAPPRERVQRIARERRRRRRRSERVHHSVHAHFVVLVAQRAVDHGAPSSGVVLQHRGDDGAGAGRRRFGQTKIHHSLRAVERVHTQRVHERGEVIDRTRRRVVNGAREDSLGERAHGGRGRGRRRARGDDARKHGERVFARGLVLERAFGDITERGPGLDHGGFRVRFRRHDVEGVAHEVERARVAAREKFSHPDADDVIYADARRALFGVIREWCEL